MNKSFLYIFLFIAGLSHNIYAQVIIKRSENPPPRWISNKLPTSDNVSFRYLISTAEARELNHARTNCLEDLAERNGKEITMADTTIHSGSLDQVKGKETNIFKFKSTIRGKDLLVKYRKIDEFRETVIYSNGVEMQRCHILYAVANDPYASTLFDDITFSRQYGVKGLALSIIPGVGQLYKGQKIKGLCIMGGEVALLSGVLTFENMRNNYRKKTGQTQNVDHIRTYSNKADNYATLRNICIGGAAALYIYNLVDAWVSPGAKRMFVKNNKNKFTFHPIQSTDIQGASIAYNF